MGFKGNKALLPSKTCIVCGREMTWRKSWAKHSKPTARGWKRRASMQTTQSFNTIVVYKQYRLVTSS